MDAQSCDLERLDREGRLRTLVARAGEDFSSNDYLGLAHSDILRGIAEAALARGVAVGSGGSRLLRGNCEEHEALEAEACAFFGRPAALFMPTGFSANSAVFATLPQSGDLILYDELVHASVHDGLRLTRADTRKVRHNDAQAFDDAIGDWRGQGGTGKPWIAVESLYSMDGDFAPLDALQEVAKRHDAMLAVDEAHGTGVFGEGGRGLLSGVAMPDNLITLHTFGKALGCEGALLCGPKLMRDHLINRARGFIFSTAPSPLTAAIARGSLALMPEMDDRRAALQNRIASALERLEPLGATCHGSPIIPLILGDNTRAIALGNALRKAGFDVRGIRPPTVPEGSARLRIVMTLNASDTAFDLFAETLQELLA
ncbi:MAG: 8-amino-7-oxononanoate synthase [Erythrobacter sp.]